MRFCQIIIALALVSETLLAAPLFGDRVLAKGKGFEIKSSQVEESYIAFKANKVAAGERVAEADTKEIEEQILDKLINTKVILGHATEPDRTNAAATTEKFIEEKRSHALSEAAFNRQIRAVGLSPEQFRDQILEQATVKAVIDRELRARQKITDEDIKKYYDEHPDLFKEPEKWTVQHIHLAFRDRLTLQELSPEALEVKRQKMDALLKRAKSGEDFTKLVKENTEDMLTRDDAGQYTFSKGQMPVEFEAAAKTLKPGQISDIVTTRYGWHIIKLLDNIPPKTQTLAEAKDKIKEALLQEATQKALPDFIKELRKEAGIEILADAKK
jgi:parvulin-like peptidyl-prolyl isomerase